MIIPISEAQAVPPHRGFGEVLQLQQVARSSDGAVANSVWLYYVAPGAEEKWEKSPWISA